VYHVGFCILALCAQGKLKLRIAVEMVFDRLCRPVTRISVSTPATIAAAYCTSSLSTIGRSSFGIAFVASMNLVPNPATGKTAFLTLFAIIPEYPNQMR
jgi:hypothetical protein